MQTKRNDLGQLLYEKQEHSDDVERQVDYSYYQGNLKGGQLKYVYFPSSSSNRIKWNYDNRGRPTDLYRKIDTTETEVGKYSWNDDGSISKFERGNDLETHYSYEAVGRLGRLDTKTGQGTTVFDLHFEYDKEGNRLTQRIDEETYWDERYYYDTLYRLEEMKRGHVYPDQGDWVVSNVQRTEDWDLDLLGNWNEYDVTGDETISEDRTHNDLNQITAIDQTSLTYDLQGNLTSDGTKTYEWDIRGRLKKVKQGETTLAEMAYDAYGRRVTKDDGTDVEHYYYDGWCVTEEYTDDGESTTLSARNVWGLYLDETVVRTSVTDSKDYYPCLSPIYSPLRIYDGNASLVARVEYTPYGKPTLVDSGGDPVSIDFPHLFTGQRHDTETASYYYKNRFFSDALGRFLRCDPLRYGGLRFNLYEYTASTPVGAVDPEGLLYPIGFYRFCKLTYVEPIGEPELAEVKATIQIKSDTKGLKQYVIAGLHCEWSAPFVCHWDCGWWFACFRLSSWEDTTSGKVWYETEWHPRGGKALGPYYSLEIPVEVGPIEVSVPLFEDPFWAVEARAACEDYRSSMKPTRTDDCPGP